jgi:ABC-type multidrug transport system fused ATPase/permease subunit
MYDFVNGNSWSDYPRANQELPYFIYSVVYFVINFGAFFILNTGLEAKIVRRMHKELKEKRERMAKLNSSKPSSTELANTSQADEEKSREKEDSIKERRVIKMVVLNSIFNFVLRAPDMLFWFENTSLLMYVFTYRFGSSFVPGRLSLVADIGYLTFILTFTTNFIIFYKFNKKFNEAVVF